MAIDIYSKKPFFSTIRIWIIDLYSRDVIKLFAFINKQNHHNIYQKLSEQKQ